MLDRDGTLLLVSGLVFTATLIGVHRALTGASSRQQIGRRFAATHGFAAVGPAAQSGWLARVDPARLGLKGEAHRRLRRELVRAGFFGPGAPAGYAIARLGALCLPVIGFLIVNRVLPPDHAIERVLSVLVLAAIALILPSAYLKRRQRLLRARYQALFPDYLDMLVMCINAGLGLDAALDRATRELGAEDRHFRVNLELMAGETRAGRGLPDALGDWADRLDLREAHSFAGLLRQTLELGTDVSLALSTFSDEMRLKRLARAEEKAAALPPKLTLPLGLFIFPVVLIVVLAPAIQRVFGVLSP